MATVFVRFVSVISLLGVTTSAAFAAEVESQIESVTVYPSGATVTRVANIALSAGSNAIDLVNLVGDLDAERLRIDIDNADVQIGQIRLSEVQSRDAFDQEVAELEEKIEQLKAEMFTVVDDTAAAKLQLKFLDGIATGYAKDAGYEGSRGSADTASWRAALQLLSSASDAANKRIRNNERTSRQQGKDLSLLQRELQQLRGGAMQSSTVSMSLRTSRSINVELRLHYYQDDAEWSPLYEARLDSDSGRLQLAQQARVYQGTDEDWRNIRLTLSTSEPSGELQAPVLDSEFLSIYQPDREAVKRGSAGASMAMADSYSLEEVVVSAARVKARVGNFAVSYDVPGQTTVGNDGDESVTLDLASFDFPVQLVTQVVPRESTQAFLAAKFVYDRPMPLYSSVMTVYVDGAFAGNTQMPTAMPQEEVVLPMGQDRRIVVSAESQGGADDQGGIINKRRTEMTDYLFTITNRRAAATQIEVLDLYPVARSKTIKVAIPRTATEPSERDIDDQPGLVVWKKALAPGEEWRIQHQYSVTYPADQVLVRE